MGRQFWPVGAGRAAWEELHLHPVWNWNNSHCNRGPLDFSLDVTGGSHIEGGVCPEQPYYASAFEKALWNQPIPSGFHLLIHE